MEYTEKKKEQLWELYGLNDENEEDIDIEKVQRFLNDSEMFCSFGENLSRIIREKMPLGAEETPTQFLLKCSKESGVVLNRNTAVNWISGGLRPKKGNESRENMVKIAFALKLSVEETYRLFHYCTWIGVLTSAAQMNVFIITVSIRVEHINTRRISWRPCIEITMSAFCRKTGPYRLLFHVAPDYFRKNVLEYSAFIPLTNSRFAESRRI